MNWSQHLKWLRRGAALVLAAAALRCPDGVEAASEASGDPPAATSLAPDPFGRPLDLRPTVSPTPFVDVRGGRVLIHGTLGAGGRSNVLVRVTTSRGETAQLRIASDGLQFGCRYPAEFESAPPLKPGALFIDATLEEDFDVFRRGHFQAEVTVVVHEGRRRPPELPSVFTCDLLDRRGRTDAQSREWPAVRRLANLFMHSQAAQRVGVGRGDFDLARPADLQWFKDHLTLYEFDHRDRDWSWPLGQRVRRTFWQSVWNGWFNASNDDPRDGNPTHTAWTNYVPYAFANDFADVLLIYLMRQGGTEPLDDNLASMCQEATENLLAMQHRDTTNFALRDATGRQENYTAGAFRYGMFENGEYMTEGRGWFYNPKFRDYAEGGVLNGRAVWGLGEALRRDPKGRLAGRVKEAIALALKFCLHDALPTGYTKRTRSGLVYWRDAGEHAYLVLGMLAACEGAPTMQVDLGDGVPLRLRELCVRSLNALAELEDPKHQWSMYPNVDAMAIAALAEGARLLPTEPAAGRWREVAVRVADAWMSAKVDPQERRAPAAQFGLRVSAERMTYVWRKGGRLQFYHYQDGHWMHALAELHALTGEARFRDRAVALVSYLCGNNPWQARLFNELGGVYNWTDDTDGDGIEDLLKQDMYPESTAFCQIGMLKLIGGLERETTR